MCLRELVLPGKEDVGGLWGSGVDQGGSYTVGFLGWFWGLEKEVAMARTTQCRVLSRAGTRTGYSEAEEGTPWEKMEEGPHVSRIHCLAAGLGICGSQSFKGPSSLMLYKHTVVPYLWAARSSVPSKLPWFGCCLPPPYPIPSPHHRFTCWELGSQGGSVDWQETIRSSG